MVKAGTSVIIVRKDRVLVGQRKGSHGAGVYAFPGGHIDEGDTSLKQAGEREVMEETGIHCEVILPDGMRDDLFTTFDILSKDGTKRYVTTYLLAEYIGGGKFLDEFTVEGREKDKCEKWIWVTLPQLIPLVEQSGDAAWIPLPKVLHYLPPHLDS